MDAISVLRHTWQVQDKHMANNVAYTSGKLSLHTDYPALHFAPGVSENLTSMFYLEDLTVPNSHGIPRKFTCLLIKVRMLAFLSFYVIKSC